MTGPVVELCGLPGSGKTTLAGALEKELSARGIDCDVADRSISAAVPGTHRAVRRLGHATSSSARHPAWATSSALRFAVARSASVRDTAAALVQWLAVADLTTRARRAHGVHLLEEGLVQTAWTLLLRSDGLPDRVATELLVTAPKRACSDLVLVLDVPVDVVADRLGARRSRHSRTQLLPEDQRVAELQRGRALLETLLAATPGLVHRLDVSYGATPARLAAEAADVVSATVPSS